MKNNRVRTSVRLDPAILGELRAKSMLSGVPVADLVQDAIAGWLQEQKQDLAAFEEWAGEPVISIDELLNCLKADGRM